MTKKYEIGQVILLKSTSPSFSWNDGLFFVLGQKETEIHLCKLDKDGKAQKCYDGRYMATVTGVNNKGISKTNLTYKIEKKI